MDDKEKHNNYDMTPEEMLRMLKEILENQRNIITRLENREKGVTTIKVKTPEEMLMEDCDIKAAKATNAKPLEMFIPLGEVRATKFRLLSCTTPHEWALHGVYPLYLNGDITYETIRSKAFIEATIPYCRKLNKANYDNLRQALYRCSFPLK
mgnify:FL=1